MALTFILSWIVVEGEALNFEFHGMHAPYEVKSRNSIYQGFSLPKVMKISEVLVVASDLVPVGRIGWWLLLLPLLHSLWLYQSKYAH